MAIDLRKRDENTYWWNESTITDIHEALYVLQTEWHGADPVYLSLEGKEPEVAQELHREGNGGRASSCRIEYLDIDPKVAQELIDRHFVTPMEIKHWGSTEVERKKLILSRYGAEELRKLNDAKKVLAQSLPEAGVHSKFSGLFEVVRGDRENGRRGGRLYFDLKTPQDEKVRVYPDTKEVLKLEK